MKPRKQVAALPVRNDAKGQLRVMLMTSRETQRLIVPKGLVNERHQGLSCRRDRGAGRTRKAVGSDASLFDDEDGETSTLIWSRSRKANAD
jgi:hypothetical protein